MDDGKCGAKLAGHAKLAQRMSIVYDEDGEASNYRYRGEVMTFPMSEIRELTRVRQLTMLEIWKAEVDLKIEGPRTGLVGDEVSRALTRMRLKVELAYEEYAIGNQRDALELMQQASAHVLDAQSALLEETRLASLRNLRI